jgi:hypothetical protein
MEAVLMRLTDVIIIVPALLLAAVMAQLAGRRDEGSWFASFASSNGVLALGIFLGLISWVGLARLMRGEFLTLREREFVDAARISGASNARIIFKHILPNAVGVLIVNVTLTMSAAILTETALSYLGVGVKSPDTSLGLLISQNQGGLRHSPLAILVPRPVHRPHLPQHQLHRRRPAGTPLTRGKRSSTPRRPESPGQQFRRSRPWRPWTAGQMTAGPPAGTGEPEVLLRRIGGRSVLPAYRTATLQ